MKRSYGFLFMCVLLLLVPLAGCQINPSFNQAILDNQAAIQASAGLAMDAALLNVPVADRVSVARKAYSVASIIHGLSGQQADLAAVDILAQAELAKWNSPYAPVVGSLVRVTESLVQTYLNHAIANAAITPDNAAQVAALRALLASASQGVMDASLRYTQESTAVSGAVAPWPPR